MSYPEDWPAIREAVRVRDQQCVNCHASGDEIAFNIHHVVPLSQGGSNRMSNLVLLCDRCHAAAHELRMAPVVKFHTNGSMTSAEFEKCLEYWREHPAARFHDGDDKDERYWYIPKADVDLVLDRFAS